MSNIPSHTFMQDSFKIKAYGVQELAMLYFPNSTSHSARAQLKRWILRNKRLLAALSDAGYYQGQRIFTPKQVRVIVEHLDPP